MLNRLLAPFGLRITKPQLQASMSSYDVTRPSAELENHWRHASPRSPNMDASAETRHRLRNLSRYEVKNNCYARGMIVTLANDTIGRGPRLQMLEKSLQPIEKAWKTWCRQVRLPQKLRTARAVKAADGESFLRLTNDRRRKIALDVRLYEADQVCSPTWDTDHYFDEDSHVDGIELDGNGNPQRYYFKYHHPYGAYSTATNLGNDEGQWVPERLVVHMYREDRSGQRRGIPEITPALPLYAMLRRYTLAVVSAAETAADIAGVVTSDAGALSSEDIRDIDPGVQFPIRRRTLLTLPYGWEMQQLKAEQPTTTYGEFHNAILNEIARCLNMPFNVASGNSSEYNYASGRLDHQTYYRAIDVERSEIEDYCLEKIFGEWLTEYLISQGRRAAEIDPEEFPHRWYWDPHPHVDPEKEANAVVTLWEKGLVTDDDFWLQQGKDPEQQYERLEEQSKRREAAKLPLPGVTSQTIDMSGGGKPGKEPGEDNAPEAKEAGPRNTQESQSQSTG